MNLYVTYDSRDTLKSLFSLSLSKTITKLNLGHSDKLGIKSWKISFVLLVLQTTQNSVTSRCCFEEDGNEMYQEL